MAWLPDIIAALKGLGGEARLKDIYFAVQRIHPDLPPKWEEVIRATIQAFSSDAAQYKASNPDIFYHAERGRWGLRRPDDTLLGTSQSDLFFQAVSEIDIDEFIACEGDEQKMHILVENKKAEIRKRFGIG